jgi:drug/metabolite transporter (DMT)-like permease
VFAIIPIIVSLISTFLLKEKPTFPQAIFMLVSISALIVMILCGATSLTLHPAGILLLLLSSLSMALNNVLMRYVRQDFNASEMTTVIIAEGFIVLNIIVIAWEVINGNLMEYFALATNPTFVIAGAYLGIPCTLVSAGLMAYMVRRVVAVKATIFGNLSTAISIVAGVVVLHEPLYWYHILCSILIIIGVLGVSMSGSKVPQISKGDAGNK